MGVWKWIVPAVAKHDTVSSDIRPCVSGGRPSVGGELTRDAPSADHDR
jgi:hypothetical protein